jgi:hypothetical protein
VPATSERLSLTTRDPVKAIRPYFFFWRATWRVVYYNLVCLTREMDFGLFLAFPFLRREYFERRSGCIT